MSLCNLLHFRQKPKAAIGRRANLANTMKAIVMATFPNGQKDIADGGRLKFAG